MNNNSLSSPVAGRRRGPFFRVGPGGAWRLVRPWVYLAPAGLFFLFFKFVPILRGIEYSFSEVSIVGPDGFVGFANYVRVLRNEDFWRSVWNTLIYAFGVVSIAGVLSFTLSLFLQGQGRVVRLTRTLFFIPVVAAVAVVAELFLAIFWPSDLGLLNSLITLFGVEPFPFFASPATALASVMAMHIWMLIPYNSVIYIAALATVNKDLYDAASIDGATKFQEIIYVTLPSVSGATYIVLVLSIIRVLRVFTQVYITTGGGPARSSQVIMTHIFRYGFQVFDFGYASAASMLLLVTTMLAAVTLRRFGGRR